MASLSPEYILNKKDDEVLSEIEEALLETSETYIFMLLATKTPDIEKLPVFYSGEGKA